ncbi:hypothetical protein BH24CHL6_BH24CHL6_09000 [soil metagenome]
MVPIVLATLAVLCLVLAALALRRVGPGYRVARLLASAPHVELAEASELAEGGAARYVRVGGRISSDEEFPDDHDRPLVYRRRRLEVADQRGRWQTVTQDSEAVPFGVELRGRFLALDSAALGVGLVVIPREALGKAQDLGAELAAGHPPEAASRLVIEQVSAVEQATAVGVPVLDAAGRPILSAGLGRPLILTTLAIPDAMRLLAAGRRRLVLAAGGLILGALILAVAALVALIAIG